MPHFRSKPVVIEAIRWDGSVASADEIETWSKGATACYARSGREPGLGSPDSLTLGVYIKTLEGEMRADPGDWIIKGTRGEFYPCKPDVFETKYEAA